MLVRSSPVFILNLLLDVIQILARNVALKVLAELLSGRLQVLLVVLEDHRLVVLLQIIRKHICAHERLTTLAQNVNGLLQKLNLDEVKEVAPLNDALRVICDQPTYLNP